MVDTLNCETCHNDFPRPTTRGRPPKYCPDCRGLTKKPEDTPERKLNAQQRVDQLEMMLKSTGVHISQHRKD